MSILILGLGNPGKEYKNTRHNVGFEVLNAIANEVEVKLRDDAKLHAEVAEVNMDGQKLILAKPTTYMNKSGDALTALLNAYKIEKQNAWIVYDDASMELGSLRVRAEGSSGGHNGIKSITDALGTQTFWRFKIGVDCPPDNVPLEDWVLSKFTKEQNELLGRVIELTKETILNAVQTEPVEESETLE